MLGGGPGAIRKLDQRESWGARPGLHLTSFPRTPALSLCFLRFFAQHTGTPSSFPPHPDPKLESPFLHSQPPTLSHAFGVPGPNMQSDSLD